MQISYALYKSRARKPVTEELVIDILAASARHNPHEGLTGFLHVEQDRFLQYLEGPPGPLARKIGRIRKDRRHDRFAILAEGKTDERLFPHWDMGRIDPSLLPSDAVLASKPWLRKRFSADPLEIIMAFARHAGQAQAVQIEPMK